MRSWAAFGGVAMFMASCTFPKYAVEQDKNQIAASVCIDGLTSSSETGVDCGGICPPCSAGQSCAEGKDCESGVCNQQICQVAICDDSLRNGDETDIDCGGVCSRRCGIDEGCDTAHDCDSGVCAVTCQPPSCTDHARNGTETDVDCGGDCKTCDNGRACKAATDCSDGLCKESLCVSRGCRDGVKNGDETDVDCGGSCNPCAQDGVCSIDADCQSLLCDAQDYRCTVASCSDGVKNGDEPDIDCGAGCPGCATGQTCNTSTDCDSGACKSGTCVPSIETGMVLSRVGWQATASSSTNSGPPAQALDGDPDTRWTSNKEQVEGMWFTVDMRQPQAFFQITLDAHSVYDGPALFDVYLSNDGQYGAAVKTRLIGSDVTTIHFDSAQYARYLHFVLDGKGVDGKWWSIYELNVSQ